MSLKWFARTVETSETPTRLRPAYRWHVEESEKHLTNFIMAIAKAAKVTPSQFATQLWNSQGLTDYAAKVNEAVEKKRAKDIEKLAKTMAQKSVAKKKK
jgi:hypothetical protein